MTDTAALIEQLREAIAYERTLSAPAEHSIACIEDAIQALSRLTAPPPEEIAGLIERLEHGFNWLDKEEVAQAEDDMDKAAAALRSLAQQAHLADAIHARIAELSRENRSQAAEIDRLAKLADSYRDLAGEQQFKWGSRNIALEQRIRELEAERDAIPEEPTEAMLVAARDWSYKKYGKPIGNDAASGCWKAMFAAIREFAQSERDAT